MRGVERSQGVAFTLASRCTVCRSKIDCTVALLVNYGGPQNYVVIPKIMYRNQDCSPGLKSGWLNFCVDMPVAAWLPAQACRPNPASVLPPGPLPRLPPWPGL